MDLKLFRKINVERSEAPEGYNHNLKDWNVNDWMVAIMGELGEAANFAKKIQRINQGINLQPGQEDDVNVLYAEFQKEIADVFIYIDLLCASLDIDLSEIVIDKFDSRSIEMGYPELLRDELNKYSLVRIKEPLPAFAENAPVAAGSKYDASVVEAPEDAEFFSMGAYCKIDSSEKTRRLLYWNIKSNEWITSEVNIERCFGSPDYMEIDK
jgi:NTP pyrophosphatase (non-canonical NTP hydrolase)